MYCSCGNLRETRSSKGTLRPTCSSCRRKPWHQFKKDQCECCGFVPVWKGQLDVDHIDGNKKNNSPDNLQTLCANCHRLKTFLNGDHKTKAPRPS